MKKIEIIESLRAIAAISVCLFHFVCTTVGLFEHNYITDAFRYGRYGVHIFFVISGFIIPYSLFYSNYKISSFFKFIAKRFIRIEPPYLVSILLVIGLILLKHFFHIGNDEIEQLSLTRVLLHLGYLINFSDNYEWLNTVYWTLAIEFQFYLFVALCFFLFTNSNLGLRSFAYLISFLMDFLPIGAEHYPHYSSLFLLGIITFLLKSKKINQIEFWIIYLLCLFSLYFLKDPLFAIIGGVTSLIILYYSEIKIPVFNALGKISYSIYLIHPIIGGGFINIMSRHVNTTFQKIGIVIIGTIITILSSYLMYYLVEKPSKKASSKLQL